MFRWADALAALDQNYALPSRPGELVGEIDALHQLYNEDVATFTVRFDVVHQRLITTELSNKGTAENWYVKALKPSIRIHLQEKIAADGTFDNYDVNDCVGVVNQLRRMARAKEKADNERFRANKQRERFRTARGESLSSRSTQNWRSGQQSDSRVGDEDTAKLNALAMVASYARKLGLSEDLVSKRMDANQCLNCALQIM